MPTDSEMNKKIIAFLKSVPNLQDSKAHQAFIAEIVLDKALAERLVFGQSLANFVSSLVDTLSKYGKLEDGRDSLEAALEAAKERVGSEAHHTDHINVVN